jgi:hypothetical protein
MESGPEKERARQALRSTLIALALVASQVMASVFVIDLVLR